MLTGLRVFSHRLAEITKSFAREAVELLNGFHKQVDDQAHTVARYAFGLDMLRRQLATYTAGFEDCATSISRAIKVAQKDINRGFIPVIQSVLEPTYTACFQERGKKD